MNSPGPSGKAKYSKVTDSEPGEGSEIVPETVCLQAVGGRKTDGVPFA